jgi:hypothetical protein
MAGQKAGRCRPVEKKGSRHPRGSSAALPGQTTHVVSEENLRAEGATPEVPKGECIVKDWPSAEEDARRWSAGASGVSQTQHRAQPCKRFATNVGPVCDRPAGMTGKGRPERGAVGSVTVTGSGRASGRFCSGSTGLARASRVAYPRPGLRAAGRAAGTLTRSTSEARRSLAGASG